MWRVVIPFLALVFSAPSLGGSYPTSNPVPDGWAPGCYAVINHAAFPYTKVSACEPLSAAQNFPWVPNWTGCYVQNVTNNVHSIHCTNESGNDQWAGNAVIWDDSQCADPDAVMGSVGSSTNPVCGIVEDPCVLNPNSPECQACYPLSPDQWSTDLAQIYGYEDEFCTPEYLSDEQECQNVLGYANDAQVCIDDQESCTAQGGSYGTISFGDGTPEAVCIPSDYGDDIPNCDIGTVNVVIPQLDGFGFACSSPLDPPLPDDPTDQDVLDQDTDNDGIPDRQDPDIDGDGVPNSQDPDIDGDGVPNEDETESDNNGTVNGGLTCSARPSCSGDPVQCSVVLQTWSTRCEAKEIGQGITRLEAAVRDMQNALEEGLSAEGFDPDGEAITDGEPAQETFDFSADIANIYNQGGASGSCPADTIVNTSFGQIAIPWTMLCEFASTIRPLVIFLFGLAAFRMTMRAF